MHAKCIGCFGIRFALVSPWSSLRPESHLPHLRRASRLLAGERRAGWNFGMWFWLSAKRWPEVIRIECLAIALKGWWGCKCQEQPSCHNALYILSDIAWHCDILRHWQIPMDADVEFEFAGRYRCLKRCQRFSCGIFGTFLHCFHMFSCSRNSWIKHWYFHARIPSTYWTWWLNNSPASSINYSIVSGATKCTVSWTLPKHTNFAAWTCPNLCSGVQVRF